VWREEEDVAGTNDAVSRLQPNVIVSGPHFTLSIARVDPLPHQLEAVYDYFLKLPRIRFICAATPELRAIQDPARLGWQPVVAVEHYRLAWERIKEATR
jgi:hypothetical protein